MGNDSHANAMTEVALALAMGIFSILVLALVSMGAGFTVGVESAFPATDRAEVRASVQHKDEAAVAGGGAVVIHYRGRFFDVELNPIDPTAMSADGELIVAVDPAATAAEVIALTNDLADRNVVITTLTPEWLQTLKEFQP